jgi:hypothetical protein
MLTQLPFVSGTRIDGTFSKRRLESKNNGTTESLYFNNSAGPILIGSENEPISRL